MVRGSFVIAGAVAALFAIASCEGTEGLSDGEDAPDAATDAPGTEDVTSKPDVVDGSVGDGGGCVAPTPDPAFLSDAVEIDSSGHFVCAVRANGQVVCWGDNLAGQLGVTAPDAGGTVASSEKPVVVPGVTGATHVAVGYQHACAVVTGGSVFCWGNGSKGQTGIGGGTTSGPVQIYTSGFTPITNVVALSAGGAFTCALTQGGGVQCWGDDDKGQLGSPAAGSATSSPDPLVVPGVGVATSISAGFFHACAMTANGARCWGSSANGELGRSAPADGGAPGEYAAGVAVARITASTVDTCAIDLSGNAICSGYNLTGQLGATNSGGGSISSPFPIPELALGDITDVDVGWAHTCGTRKDESAFCMSGVAIAALGRGPIDASAEPDNAAHAVLDDGTGTNVLKPVATIKVGGNEYGEKEQHTCALVKPACAKSGQVYCWGDNTVGQLGDGTKTKRDRPVKVVAP